MQTRWLVVVFAGLLSNEPERVAGDTTAENCITAAAKIRARMSMLGSTAKDVAQHRCGPGGCTATCPPAYPRAVRGGARGENMLVANLEIIKEEGNVV